MPHPLEMETIELLREQGLDFTPYIVPPLVEVVEEDE